jgi:hypothetical protein
MANVPNTDTFGLNEVYNSVSGHTSATLSNLSSCLGNAVSAYYNSTYNNISYAPVDSQRRFRDYKPYSGTPASISISVGGVSNPSVGVYTTTITASINCPATMLLSFSLELDFLSGSVPGGQSEARSVTMTPPFPYSPQTSTGSGLILTWSGVYNAGISTVAFSTTLTNDNWNSPRPSSSFRIKLVAGQNTQLTVANGTSTNASTFVYTVLGVTTTFMTITPTYSGRAPQSGHMIYYSIARNSGPSYTAGNGYKPIEVALSYGTGGYSSSKEFVVSPISGSSPYGSYMSSSITNGYYQVETLDTLSGALFHVRYTLLNRSGSSGNYSFTLEQYKYCSFTTINYSQSIDSFIPGKHILYIESFSGNNGNLPMMTIIPGTNSYGSSETYAYKYVASCPNGGYIRVSYAGNTVVDLYNGQEWQVVFAQSGPNFPAVVTGSYITTLSGGIQSNQAIQFNGSITSYITIVPTSSNIMTHSQYPYKFGYYGIIA